MDTPSVCIYVLLLSLRQVVNGYVFFDWFAIPQITARTKGQNEDSDRSDAAKAVQSIPFYVEAGPAQGWHLDLLTCYSYLL